MRFGPNRVVVMIPCAVGRMLYMVWTTSMSSTPCTFCVVHDISSTACTCRVVHGTCHMLTTLCVTVLHDIKDTWCGQSMNSVFHAVCTIFTCRGGVDSVPHSVDNMHTVGNMSCTTCPHAVGNMGHVVGA